MIAVRNDAEILVLYVVCWWKNSVFWPTYDVLNCGCCVDYKVWSLTILLVFLFIFSVTPYRIPLAPLAGSSQEGYPWVTEPHICKCSDLCAHTKINVWQVFHVTWLSLITIVYTVYILKHIFFYSCSNQRGSYVAISPAWDWCRIDSCHNS